MALKLIKLTREYERQLGDMLDEWIKDIEENHTNHSPWKIFRNDYHDFDRYLAELEQKERGRLLGAVNIRHCLNDALLKTGGHIGDGIRPSERRKGYGTAIVGLALEECGKLGIEKVLMVCSKSNIASAKTIIRNGGVLENEIVNEDGEVEQRYWITLG